MRRIDFFIYLFMAAFVGFTIGYKCDQPAPIEMTPPSGTVEIHVCTGDDALKWWTDSNLVDARKKLCGKKT